MVRERKGKSKPKVEEVVVAEPETLEVPGPPKRDLFKREKSPFEVGDRKELQVASSHAIIDKACVMDISGGACSVAGKMDEYISLLFTDYCSLDKASCEDISEVKIVIIEEEDVPTVIMPDVDVAAEEEARKQAELEEARRQRRREEEAEEERRREEAEAIKREAAEAAAAIVAAEAEAKRIVEEAAKKKLAEEEAIAKKAEEEAQKKAEAEARKIAEAEEIAAAEAAAIAAKAAEECDSDDDLIPVKEEVDASDWEAVEEEAPLIPAVLADLIAERELAAEEAGEGGEEPEKEMTEKDRDLEWQRQRQMMRPPLVISHLKSRAVPKNSVAKLTCNVTGPGIMVRWLKNGNPIEINPSKYKFFNSEGLLSLEILNTRTKDAAEYTCFIKNKNGETSTVASVQVYDSVDTERPVPPTFVSIKGNLITVIKFKLYKVNCKCLKRNAKVLNNNSTKDITDSHVKLCKIMFNVLFNTKECQVCLFVMCFLINVSFFNQFCII